MSLVIDDGFLSSGWRGDGNSDGQRELQLLGGAASPSVRLSGGERAKGRQTDPGAGTGPSGQLQGEEERKEVKRRSDKKRDKEMENKAIEKGGEV